MPKKVSRCVRTLNEFVKWAEQFQDGQYLFRGVSKHTHSLEASAYRRLPENERNQPQELRKINRELIERARLLGHDYQNGQPRSDLELLAELQHFGAATCLIDFTRNALVALWFACQHSSSGEDNGKVFAVRVDDIARFKTINPQQLTKGEIDDFFEIDENGKYPLYQWQPKHQNNRIIAQQSVFIFGGAQIDVAAECIPLKSNKRDILTALDKLAGITEVSLFPDFDGFARVYAQDRRHVKPDPDAYLQRAIETHQEGRWDDAIVYYDELVRLEPDNLTLASAYEGIGFAYISKGRLDLAIANFTEAIEQSPNNAEAYSVRGFAYRLKEEFDNAIKDYDEAIRLKPDFSEAYYNRGIIYDQKGEVNNAIKDYDEAIRLKPDFPEAYYNRGAAYLLKSESNTAVEDFDEAIRLKPDFPEAYHNRAAAYLFNGELNLAITDYTKAIELEPQAANAYYSRGIVQLQLQEWREAEADLTAARNNGMDIGAEFRNDYESIETFEADFKVDLPKDITLMLTQP